jgi:hypothetical protein
LFSRLLVEDQAEEFGAKLDNSGYVFSLAPDHGTFLDPSTTTHHAVAVGTANRAVALLADKDSFRPREIADPLFWSREAAHATSDLMPVGVFGTAARRADHEDTATDVGVTAGDRGTRRRGPETPLVLDPRPTRLSRVL